MIEGDLDGIAPVVYCLEASAAQPSKSDAKCEDDVSKALVKFVSTKAKCYEKCNAGIVKGTIPPNSCIPGATTDPKTIACVSDPKKGVEAKAAAAIDKACFTAPATAPACLIFQTSAGWTGAAETAVDGTTGTVYCGSPSGAFLN